MTADATRRNWTDLDSARAASEQSQALHKRLEAARQLLEEHVQAFDNQPAAWNPQQHIERCRLFLAMN